MKKKLFLVKVLLLSSILTSVAYGRVVEGMVLSVSKKEVVIITKNGKKEIFPFPSTVAKGKKGNILLVPRPGSIVILKVKKGRIEEIKIKGIPQ